MIRNGKVVGFPLVDYRGTKASIEALTGVIGGESAHATDTGEFGWYDAVNVQWHWLDGSGGSGLPATTAENDFVVGSSTIGTWIKKTLTETVTILRTILDNVFIRPQGAWTDGNFVSSDGITGLLNKDSGVSSSDFAVAAKGVTNGDSHDHTGGDGAQIDHTTLSNIGTNTHAQIDTQFATTLPATYAPIAKGVTNGDSHDHSGGDGGTIDYSSLSGDPKISGDEATLKNRRDNGRTLREGFDGSSIPSGYGWAGAPFATPNLFDMSTYPSMAYFRHSGGAIRSFLYTSTIPGASDLNAITCGFIAPTATSYIGLRFDDGSDNNYFEWLLSGDLKGTVRTRVGGGAVATVQGGVLTLPMLYVIRAFRTGTLYSSWGAQTYLSMPWQAALIQMQQAVSATTNASWTPTRSGILFEGSVANVIAVVDSILD